MVPFVDTLTAGSLARLRARNLVATYGLKSTIVLKIAKSVMISLIRSHVIVVSG